MRVGFKTLNHDHPATVQQIRSLQILDPVAKWYVRPIGDGADAQGAKFCVIDTLSTIGQQWMKKPASPEYYEVLKRDNGNANIDLARLKELLRSKYFPSTFIAKTPALGDELGFREHIWALLFEQVESKYDQLLFYLSFNTNKYSDHAAAFNLTTSEVISGDRIFKYTTKNPLDDIDLLMRLDYRKFNFSRQIFFREKT